MLDQPPWEALFSFILSANNNVVRIRSLVYAISRAYGPEADGLYGIPGPEAMAGRRKTNCAPLARATAPRT